MNHNKMNPKYSNLKLQTNSSSADNSCVPRCIVFDTLLLKFAVVKIGKCFKIHFQEIYPVEGNQGFLLTVKNLFYPFH